MQGGSCIDNPKLARLAKLAGGSSAGLAAGISMQVRLATRLHAAKHCCSCMRKRRELAYALGYANEVGKLSGWRSKRLNLTLPRFHECQPRK